MNKENKEFIKHMAFLSAWGGLAGWVWFWGHNNNWQHWIGYLVWIISASQVGMKVYVWLWPKQRPFDDEYRVRVNIIYNSRRE